MLKKVSFSENHQIMMQKEGYSFDENNQILTIRNPEMKVVIEMFYVNDKALTVLTKDVEYWVGRKQSVAVEMVELEERKEISIKVFSEDGKRIDREFMVYS